MGQGIAVAPSVPMTEPDNQYTPREPSLPVFLVAAVLGAGVSLVLATHILELTSDWMSLLLGGTCGIVGLFMGENIGDAIIFTVVAALMVLLVLTVIPAVPSLRTVIVPVAAGFCLGKLVSGVWKEISKRKISDRR
jgi:hypothetical protein